MDVFNVIQQINFCIMDGKKKEFFGINVLELELICDLIMYWN